MHTLYETENRFYKTYRVWAKPGPIFQLVIINY